MKKTGTLVLALVAVMVLTACHGMRINYTEDSAQIEEHRQLAGFERIELLGSIDVKYMQADSFSVLVKAPDTMMESVETRVEGNSLTVGTKPKNGWNGLNGNVTVYVTSPDLIGVAVKGSGDFECKRRLDTDTLDVELKGSGDVEFDDVICDQLRVTLQGSGDVEVDNVTAQRSELLLMGSGDIKVTFSNSGTVHSTLKGSGDIELKGDVQESQSQVRGSGDVQTRHLTVGKANNK